MPATIQKNLDRISPWNVWTEQRDIFFIDFSAIWKVLGISLVASEVRWYMRIKESRTTFQRCSTLSFRLSDALLGLQA